MIKLSILDDFRENVGNSSDFLVYSWKALLVQIIYKLLDYLMIAFTASQPYVKVKEAEYDQIVFIII